VETISAGKFRSICYFVLLSACLVTTRHALGQEGATVAELSLPTGATEQPVAAETLSSTGNGAEFGTLSSISGDGFAPTGADVAAAHSGQIQIIDETPAPPQSVAQELIAEGMVSYGNYKIR
jgi:hypothetical protein